MTTDYLNLAFEAWRAAAPLRATRRRLKSFTFGRQWGDPSPTAPGMTDGENALRCGALPHTNNLLRQMVKTAVGIYRRDFAPEVPASIAPVAARNSLAELDARSLEEFLISGCAVQRVVSEHRPEGAGVWVDIVSPDDFFVNPYRDPRGCDIELIGMLHTLSPRKAASRFCKGNPARREELWRELTAGTPSELLPEPGFESFASAGASRCRLVELWTMEIAQVLKGFDPVSGRMFMCAATEMPKIKRANRLRAKSAHIVTSAVDTVRWKCRWLSPGGMVLDEYFSPFAHSSHPFVVKMYPLIDGEVHSLVEDVIDQQKYINRMVSVIDKIMQSSAKGVLLFPEDRKPESFSWNDIADLWSDCQGIIPFKTITTSSAMPQQIVTSGATADAHKLLSTQIEMMQQVSGVTAGVMGKSLPANASASLIEAYNKLSATSLTDIFGAFTSFVDRRNFLVANT